MWLVVYLGLIFALLKLTDCPSPNAPAVPNIFNDRIHVTVHVSRAIIRSTSRIQFITTIKSIITLQYAVFINVLTCKIIVQGLDSSGNMIDNILIANTCTQPDIFQKDHYKNGGWLFVLNRLNRYQTSLVHLTTYIMHFH